MTEMKQLREIAESYYEASSPEMKARANKFFQSMDHDGDKKVGLEEFLSFMKSHGYDHMRHRSFFGVLDESGHGTLSFMDVMTLYYIIKSGRPFCDCCSAFIPGIFFSCVQCFNAKPSPFNICHSCYKSKKIKHSHSGGGALFLDNYILLQSTRHSSTATTIVSQPQTRVSRQPPREGAVPASPSRRHGKSPPEDVEDVSASDDFATTYMRNEFNKKVAQSLSDHRPLKRSVSNYTATPSLPVTNYVSPSSRRPTRDPAASTAIVPATRPPKGTRTTEVASLAFKALDMLIVVGNLANVIVTGACTIM